MRYAQLSVLAILFVFPIFSSAQDYSDKSSEQWVRLLKDKNPDVRQTAVHALGILRVRDKEAIAALAERLKDREERIRAEAADSLGRIGYSARGTLPRLIDVLKTEKADSVRAASALAIGYVGGSKEAVDVLAEALRKDKCALVRSHAARALARMGRVAKPAVPALVIALKDSHVDVRRNAYYALKRLDPSKLR